MFITGARAESGENINAIKRETPPLCFFPVIQQQRETQTEQKIENTFFLMTEKLKKKNLILNVKCFICQVGVAECQLTLDQLDSCNFSPFSKRKKKKINRIFMKLPGEKQSRLSGRI